MPLPVEAAPLLSPVVQGSLASPGRPFFLLLFWMAVAVLAVAEGVLVAVTLRRGRHRGWPGRSSMVSRTLEVAWTLIPALLILGLLLLSWPALREV